MFATVPILESLRAEILPAIAGGAIRTLIDSTSPAAEASEVAGAAARLRSGEAIGKAVFTF